MQESDLKELWKLSNEKLEKNLILGNSNMQAINQLKVYHFLEAMKPIKIFALLVGILWVGIGTYMLTNMYLYTFSAMNKFFLFSATMQVLLTAIALVIYIYQLVTIYEVEISDPILKTQEKLIKLKLSTLWVVRILFLQLPLWSIFWWNETMLKQWNLWQWLILGLLTLLLTILAIWLFLNITYENRNKKWFQWLFNGKEWTPLIKSIELLEQIEDYK